jgi:ATP-binding cassette, subfamily B, multidrug efflux pump
LPSVINSSKLANLDEDINAFPDNYETMLGERGVTLSGGQKQRLAIARAALKNPTIFILDDALSAVDTNTEEKIIKNINQFMQNRTTIIISHRISTIKNCSKIIVMDNGEIVESGTHDELVELGGRYSDIYSRQQLEEEISNL